MTQFHNHFVVGGAGFLGSHLCTALLLREDVSVWCVDNLVTGSIRNIEHLRQEPRFRFFRADGAEFLKSVGRQEHVATVWNLAALASPIAYFSRPLETLWAGAEVHRAALEFATDHGARCIFSSTSEVYGDPEVHPQPETYWGRVNPVGFRSQYDESKRYGESMAAVFRRYYGLDIRVARIFNTYGPGMAVDDGRMIPAFFKAAFRKAPLPVHGQGNQTRSLCYVSDLIDGLLALEMASRSCLEELTPQSTINLGNPHEETVETFARLCWASVHGPDSFANIVYTDRHPDDPGRRCPDIRLAREVLSWQPRVGFKEGLDKTKRWFGSQLGF